MQNSRRALSRSLFTTSIGRSVEGRDILLYSTPEAGLGGTLLLGGTHGDEWATILLLESFLEVLRSPEHPEGAIRVVPVVNPDGLERNWRYNANRVDLNRNFGTGWSPDSDEPPGPAPWSEPESCALRDLIINTQPERIVSLHWALAEIDADGPQSIALASAMWDALTPEERAPYRVTFRKTAPLVVDETPEGCPGSMGQWCGYTVRYANGTAPAMITLELPYDPLLPRPDRLPIDHLQTLKRNWAEDHRPYMAAVEGPVFKMLLAACRHR